MLICFFQFSITFCYLYITDFKFQESLCSSASEWKSIENCLIAWLKIDIEMLLILSITFIPKKRRLVSVIACLKMITFLKITNFKFKYYFSNAIEWKPHVFQNIQHEANIKNTTKMEQYWLIDFNEEIASWNSNGKIPKIC